MNSYSKERLQLFVSILSGSRDYQFWFLQIVGWIGLCVVTFLSLTLWYNAPEWAYVAHTIVQAMLGMLVAIPLRYFYRTHWNKPVIKQVYFGVTAIIVSAIIWTVARMVAFQIIVTEEHLWNDFGGWYFGSFMVFASWSFLYFGIKYYRLLGEEQRRVLSARQLFQEEQVKRLEAEALSREAQLKMLRYQLNPHFLFNTLNSISSLIKIEKPDNARKMISELSSFLRFSLETDPALKVSLAIELEALAQYLNVEKERYGDRLLLEFNVSEEARIGLLPSLLLQPLYENALKHAIASRSSQGKISLSADVKDQRLRLVVTDDGPGLKSDSGPLDQFIETRRGVGLKNIRDRLRSQYGADYTFDLLSVEPSGLKIIIEIPFEEEQQKWTEEIINRPLLKEQIQ